MERTVIMSAKGIGRKHKIDRLVDTQLDINIEGYVDRWLDSIQMGMKIDKYMIM